MLQVENKAQLKISSDAIKSNEALLQQVISNLLAQPVKLKMSEAICNAEVIDNYWFMLRSGSGVEIALDLRTIFGIKQRIEYYTHTALLAAELYKTFLEKSDQGLMIVDPLLSSPMKIYEISVFSQQDVLIGRISAALPADSKELTGIHLQNGEGVEPVSETPSEDTDNSLVLSLGSVQLDLDKFLELRTGMKIVCSLPAEFETRLSFDGTETAKVSVKLQNEKLELTVLSCTC